MSVKMRVGFLILSIVPRSYFAAYEVVKKALTPEGSNPADLNLGSVMIAGAAAGVAMWSIAIPPDVSSHCC